MAKIKIMEIYWDDERGETEIKEKEGLNELTSTALMDVRQDLMHDMEDFFNRLESKWKHEIGKNADS